MMKNDLMNRGRSKMKYFIAFFCLGIAFLLSQCNKPIGIDTSPSGDEIRVSDEWTRPEQLPPPVSSSAWEDAPRISPDGQVLYFTRGKDRDVEGYVSRKTKDGWSQPNPLDFNLKSFPTGASHSQDDEIIYFASVRPGGYGSGDIYVSKKVNGRWTKGDNLGSPPNTKYMESEPFIASDHMTLYFASNRPGGRGKADIYMTQKKRAGWSEPVNLGSPVNSEFDDSQPFLTQDGKELYFMAVNRKGIPGPAIFRTVRIGEKWGEPEVVITGFVGEPSLTADKQILYFVHIIRKGGKLADAKIMFTHRRRP